MIRTSTIVRLDSLRPIWLDLAHWKPINLAVAALTLRWPMFGTEKTKFR